MFILKVSAAGAILLGMSIDRAFRTNSHTKGMYILYDSCIPSALAGRSCNLKVGAPVHMHLHQQLFFKCNVFTRFLYWRQITRTQISQSAHKTSVTMHWIVKESRVVIHLHPRIWLKLTHWKEFWERDYH